STCRAPTPTGGTFSTGSDESPAGDDVLPARGRRRRAAPAEVRDPPAELRHRDARTRPGRPEVGAPRRGGDATDAGLGAPRPLSRPSGADPFGGPVRTRGRRPASLPGGRRVPPLARSGQVCDVGAERDPGGGPHCQAPRT